MLSQKAREKNEDEFAFGMLSANKAQAGKHGKGDTQANRLSHDAVKLLKSQDAGYLRVVAGRGRKELQKLEQEAGMESGNAKGRKIVFVDDPDEKVDALARSSTKKRQLDAEIFPDAGMEVVDSTIETENVELVPGTDSGDSGLKTTYPKSKKALAAERNALRDLRIARKRRKRLAEMRVAKLEALKKRQKEIMAAADQLELQRAKMARTVGGVNKDGVKWRIRERKR